MADRKHSSGAPLWGVSAEFETADAMVAALHDLRGRGLGRLEAYSPIPIPEAMAALRLPRRPLFPVALAGAGVGAGLMFAMCTYATMVSYKFNIGGRPAFSWPSFIVPSVSFAALTGSLAVVAAMMLLNRLPRLNHPAFNIPDFTRATSDRFFVAVESRGEEFDPTIVEAALAALPMPPRRINQVPR